MTAVYTVVAVSLLLIALGTHEAAHALALRRFGIPISEAGLGLPFAPRIVLPPTARRSFRLSLSIWLVGAYVTPHPDHEHRIRSLSYRDHAWYAGAGIVANIVMAGLLTFGEALWDGRFVTALASAAITASMWFGRRAFAAYVLPVLSLAVLVALIWSVVRTVGQPQGVVGIARAVTVSSPRAAIEAGRTLALSLGLLNMVPIFPLDGGRIGALVVQRWIGTRADALFRRVGAAAAVVLVGYSTLSDLAWSMTR